MPSLVLYGLGTAIGAGIYVLVGGAAYVAGVIAIFAVLVPFGTLVQATSGLTLGVFIAVNAALWRLKWADPRADLGTRVPGWAPVAGVIACAGLMVAAVVA